MHAQRPIDENGSALLLFALFLSLLGLAGAGLFLSTDSLSQNLPLSYETNKARAAASAGVMAMAQYYGQLACLNTACTSQGWNPSMADNAQVSGSLPVGTQAASITASVTSNTLAPATVGVGFQGDLVVQSLGTFGQTRADNQSILQAQFQQLNSGTANFVVDSSATGNGRVKTSQPKIIVSTKQSNEQNVIFHGSNVLFLPITQFPKIEPNNFQNVATMQLLMVNGNPQVYIPQNDLPLYSAVLKLPVNPQTQGGYFCPLQDASSYCAQAFSSAGISYSVRDGQWNISAASVPGFYYVQGNVTVSPGSNGISVAATESITTQGHGTGKAAATFTPFDAVSNGSPSSYCAQYASQSVLSPCETVNGTVQPIPALEGVSFVSGGDTTIGGSNILVNGDVASAGSLYLNGGGNKSFGGVLISQGGLKLNGSITLTTPAQPAQQATLGGIVFQVVGTRWLAQ
jgi:hypothetical protein